MKTKKEIEADIVEQRNIAAAASKVRDVRTYKNAAKRIEFFKIELRYIELKPKEATVVKHLEHCQEMFDRFNKSESFDVWLKDKARSGNLLSVGNTRAKQLASYKKEKNIGLLKQQLEMLKYIVGETKTSKQKKENGKSKE